MNNLTLMELNEIRPFFLRAFDEQYLMTQGYCFILFFFLDENLTIS